MYTFWNVISQKRNETEIQFLLWMIQKALEKQNNTFIVLHVFKQKSQWNCHYDECKWLLKCYWKVENVIEVQWRWRVEFGIPPPTRLTIIRTRNKFEVDGTVQDVLKGRCGRKRSSSDNESADAVMQVFAQSTKKSLRQCSREIGIEKYSIHRILRAQKWKPYIPKFVHARRHCWECTVAEGGHFERIRA